MLASTPKRTTLLPLCPMRESGNKTKAIKRMILFTYFLMAAMPGSSLPSRASSMAPPPVLT